MKFLVVIALVASISSASIIPASISSLAGGGGGMSYLELCTMVYKVYNSPIANFLPPVTQTISTAWDIVQAAYKVSDAFDEVRDYLEAEAKKAADKLQSLQPSTSNFNVTSLISSLPKPSSLTNLIPSASTSKPSSSLSLPSIPSLSSLTG